MSRDALNERVDQVLSAVGMAWRAAERPATLSGGERQRVAIARALLLRPRVLLCDEPTGNLDPHTGHEVVDLLRGIHEDDGVTVVVATHDEVISRSADRVLELRRGRLDDWGGPVRAEP
jgi:ABC-type lipoprotein export system ATPase subunit